MNQTIWSSTHSPRTIPFITSFTVDIKEAKSSLTPANEFFQELKKNNNLGMLFKTHKKKKEASSDDQTSVHLPRTKRRFLHGF